MRKWKTLLTFLLLMVGFCNGFRVQASDIKVAPVRNETEYLGREYNPDFDRIIWWFTRSH